MTLNEYEKLSDTDRAFLKLEGRCDGCGCQLANQVFIAHGEWCTKSPKLTFVYNWDRDSKKIVTNTSRRQGKSVFNNMLKEFNKIFRNKDDTQRI